RLRWQCVVYLDEIHSFRFQLLHSLAGFLWSAHSQSISHAFFWAVNERSRANDMRPDPRPLLNFCTPSIDLSEVPAHISHACHAIHDKKWKGVFCCIGQMPVHIPKTRDQEFPPPFNRASANWNENVITQPDRRNAPMNNDYCRVWLCRSSSAV